MDIWEAAIGEELNCKREPNNSVDRYAVAVVKGDTVIGHLPKSFKAANSSPTGSESSP